MKTTKFYFLFLLAFAGLNMAQAQPIDVKRQNKNIQQFIQVWGLVKYKSQKSINGQFNADQTFLALINPVIKADENQFNQLMLELVGTVDPALTAAAHHYEPKKKDYRHLIKNINYSWINAKGYSGALKKQLTALSNQVNLTGKHQYIPSVWYEGDLPNEASYPTYAFNQEEMNLLALAKAWNVIEYLFPAKYMMDKPWQKTLEEMVPIFRKVNDRASYEKSLLLLEVALNDTHAQEFLKTTNMKTIPTVFKVRYYPPFDYQTTAKGIIIKKFLSDSLAQQSSLQLGDRIVAIDGIKISKWLKERMKLIPASNEAVKYRTLDASSNGNTFAFSAVQGQVLKVKVARGSAILDLNLELLDRTNKQDVKVIQHFFTARSTAENSFKGMENIGDDITLIRAGHMYDKDVPKDEELTQLSAELKRKKALIFDFRKYPQSPGFFSYYIPMLLGKAPFVFARYYAVDLKNPGAFYLREGVENYMVVKEGSQPMGELYSGKIVILTNEDTLSMAEWFTMMLRQLSPNTTVIGSQTAGADGDVKNITLPGAYRFTFTGNGIFYADGQETQRIGIKPDVYFKPGIKDLIGSKDAQLERAIKYLKEGK